MPDLLVLMGLPGTGKSTWAKLYFDRKYAVVSSDGIRTQLAGSLKAAHGQALKPWDVFYQRIEDCLRHDVDVIADATFLLPKHRDRAREVARRVGARIHLIIFVNWWQGQERNAARPADTRVPDEVMDDMSRLWWDAFATAPKEPFDSLQHISRFDLANAA